MYQDLTPWWVQLMAIPFWGGPIYILVWTALKARAKQRKEALKGFLVAGGAWFACTIAYLVAGFMLEPCLENCSRFRTPAGNARLGALIVVYAAAIGYIVFRLHRRR